MDVRGAAAREGDPQRAGADRTVRVRTPEPEALRDLLRALDEERATDDALSGLR